MPDLNYKEARKTAERVLMAWHKLSEEDSYGKACKSKEGGLGIRPLKKMNQALLGKWLCRIGGGFTRSLETAVGKVIQPSKTWVGCSGSPLEFFCYMERNPLG